jgi:hypothetical protein
MRWIANLLRIAIRPLLLIGTLGVALPAAAQNPNVDTLYVYHVDVLEAVVRTPAEAPQACTARPTDPVRIPIDTVARKGKDSLWVTVVRMEGSTRTPIKPPADIDVYVGPRRRTLTTTMDSLAVTADPRKLAGQRVTIQEPNTGRVFCSVALPGPNPALTRPPGRPLPSPEAVVSLGASFDLLDGLRASDLYSDTRVFAPGLWRRWGAQAGIYQGRVTSTGSATGDTTARRFSFLTPSLPQDTVGGLLVRQRVFERTESGRDNTLGLYMGLNRSVAEDLYLVGLIEVRRESFRRTVRDTVISDTVLRLAPNQPIRNSVIPGSRVTSGVSYRPALMVGPRLDMRRETFNLVLQPVAGLRRIQHCTVLESGTGSRCEPEWSIGEWDVTFELEAAKSGVKLGGEVRGFQSQTPSILVFLAKEFTVEKFAEILTGAKR